MQEHSISGKGPILADFSEKEADTLCGELRRELVESVSKTGGHLASNLGVVELTVAIHRVFDTERDRLVFDVGHQCYPHKMITERSIASLRQQGGVSGFPKPSESVHDAFIAGHASNSVAVAVGMAAARDQLEEDYSVLALIGDGALTGGLAYEGMTNAGQVKGQLLVILNDNGMSITKNVGAVAEYLSRQRLKPQYLTFKKHYRRIMNATWLGRKLYRFTHNLKKAVKESILPSSMFENMGFQYLGPVDGHNMERMTRILTYAKELKGPVLLHVRTVKGKDYIPAETSPNEFHGVSPFNPETGVPLKRTSENFSSVFGDTLCKLAQADKRVCAITAAMMSGTGLEDFSQQFPERFHDVGIAEGCAVSMAAGMAQQGAIPVFAVYSTFLQRSYDMLLHDAALSGQHIVLGVDRAGLVGEDGETHQGVFDVAYLDSIPGMTVLAPASFQELRRMLTWAVQECNGPVAVRYPRGGEGAFSSDSGTSATAVLRQGTDITLVGYGTGINDVLAAADLLEGAGVSSEVIKINRISPLDSADVIASVQKTGALLVAEDCVQSGSVGQRLAAALTEAGISARTALVNCGCCAPTHGRVDQLKAALALDGQGLFRRAMEVLGRG